MTHALDFARGEVEDWVPEDGTVEPTGLPLETAKKTVTPVAYKPDIFNCHKLNPAIPIEKPNTARGNKFECQRRLIQALDFCGSEEHQLFIVHRVLTRKARAGIGLGLGLMKDPIKDAEARKQTIKSIDDLLHADDSLVLGSNTNDAISFQKTVFILMAPTTPAEDAPDEAWERHKKLINDQANLFALTDSAKRRLEEMSIVRRDILAGGDPVHRFCNCNCTSEKPQSHVRLQTQTRKLSRFGVSTQAS